MAMREITLSKAVNEAIAEEMRRDPTVFVIGEDVAEAGTPFKVLSGLVQEFGRERIVDTPISEPGFMGIAVGAAMTGSRPIVDLMFGDFLFLAMDQLCNQAAKTHYMSGGKLKARWSCAPTLARRVARRRSTRSRFMCWSPTFPG
jgi:acetoin:2,6-dichlorophenolindophenol oxidoreductase subunit beta